MPHRLGASDIIRMLNLKPLPVEGGFFRVTHKVVTGDDHSATPPVSTAMLYLISEQSFSTLHRLDTDELFHFYIGDPCEMIEIDAGNQLHRCELGHDLVAGQVVQHLVAGGHWQGTRIKSGGSWALLGTTMTPGYQQAGFESTDFSILTRLRPEDRTLVREYISAEDSVPSGLLDG